MKLMSGPQMASLIVGHANTASQHIRLHPRRTLVPTTAYCSQPSISLASVGYARHGNALAADHRV
jgi:hypothetical protein